MESSGEGQALVVDDERFSRMIVSRQLREMARWDVDTAADGADAFGKLTGPLGHKVKLLVADINMPGITGLELLRAVRMGQTNTRRDIQVLLITGHTDAPLMHLARQLHVDAILAKPLSKASLVERIGRSMKRTFGIGRPEYYEHVSIPSYRFRLSDDLICGDDGDGTLALPLREVPEGSILARDVILSSGRTMIESGRRLSAQLIGLLHDLHRHEKAALDIVWIKKSH